MVFHTVIVEREPLLRTGLERMLNVEAGIEVTGCVATVTAAEQLPPATPADLVLAGADVVDMEVTVGIGRLLTRFPEAHVVMLGPENDPGLVVGAFRAGADGYLTRSIPVAGLVRAIRGLEHSEVPLPRNLTALLVEAVRYSAPVSSDGVFSQLSPREREVLTLISRGCSNLQIAARLHLSESTVKTHVSSILRKTGSRSRHLLQAAKSA